MSIATAITNAQGRVAACYTSVNTMGGTLPETQNLANLPDAIESIPTGGSYPGLDSSFNKGEVTIEKGILADYFTSGVTETGCLAKYQTVYNNYKIVSTPTINFGSGVVSDFSTSNYLSMPQAFPSTISQADMIFKGMLTDLSSHSMLLARADSQERSFCIRSNTSKFSCYIGSWVDGTNVLSVNTWYWFRVVFDGTNWKGYTLEDNDYILEKLPDISQWRLEWTTITNFVSGNMFNIGYNYNVSSQYWKGSMNLGQSQIIVNNELWWNAKGYSGIIKRLGYTNFSIVGSPVIDNSTGVASNFSTSNYLILPSTILYNEPVDIYCKFKLTVTPNATACLVELSSSTWQGFNIAVTNNSKLRLWTSSGDAYGSTTLSLNTNYWIKCVSSSSGSSLYLSTDGETYTLETTLTNNIFSSWYLSNVYIGVRGKNTTEAFTFGEVDLSGCYINSDGTIWWNPAISSYFQTQGMLDTISGTIPSSTSSLYINYNPVSRNYMLDTLNSMKAIQVGNKWYSCPSGGQATVTGFSSYPVYSVSPSFGFIGTPTYNRDDMSYSGFSANNKILSDYAFYVTTSDAVKGFTIQLHFKTGSVGSWQMIMGGRANFGYYTRISIEPNSKVLAFNLSSGGTTFFSITSTNALTAQTEYWVRLVKPDTTDVESDVLLQFSSDGETWTTNTSKPYTQNDTWTNPCFWLGAQDGSTIFDGKIYLEGTFIEMAGERVWDMANPVTFTSGGD